MARGGIAVFLALSLMASVFCAPAEFKRTQRAINDNQVDSKEYSNITDKIHSTPSSTTQFTTVSTTTIGSDEDDDIDDKYVPSPASSDSSGSNIISLLSLANALFSASSGTNQINYKLPHMIPRMKATFASRRKGLDNEIEIDYATELKPPNSTSQRQESESSDSETSESHSESDEDDAAEESDEKVTNENGGSNSKQDSDSNASNASDNDSDYDEPPGGDGQGGGILGLLAGLSGDGDSDLGTLLATVGGIIANLSGDGVDINAVIATALGLLVGLLSDGAQNPGEVIATYLQTSLDTISGGGAQNNGAFFGKFLSTLVKGISAVEPGSQENATSMSDSAGFFFSLLMGLLGDMSKSSFGGSSKPWR